MTLVALAQKHGVEAVEAAALRSPGYPASWITDRPELLKLKKELEQ